MTSFTRLSYEMHISNTSNGHHRGQDSTQVSNGAHPRKKTTYLLPFSAHNEMTVVRNSDAILQASKGKVLVPDLAFTLSTKRSALPLKAFTLVSTQGDEHLPLTEIALTEAKANFKVGDADDVTPDHGLAFIFTGQGAQWPGMGLELMSEYPSVYKTIIDMDEMLKSLPTTMRPSWTILETIEDPQSSKKIHDAERSQAVCTALQVALVQLLRSWGIQPKYTLGHSSGEIAAAFAAGYLSAGQAILVAYLRGFAASRNNKQGAMLAVGLGSDAASEIIKDISDVCIACHNSPASVTLSGTEQAIHKVHGILTSDGVFSRKLVTSGNAYHSWLMKDAGADYEALLRRVEKLREETLLLRSDESALMFSSVTGKRYKGHEVEISYWRTNLESTVLFKEAMGALLEQASDARYLVEIGPHSALSQPIKEIKASLGDGHNTSLYFLSLKRHTNAVQSALKLAGSLFLAGYPVNLGAVNSEELIDEGISVESGDGIVHRQQGRLVVDLPPYQWQYESAGDHLWTESRLSREGM